MGKRSRGRYLSLSGGLNSASTFDARGMIHVFRRKAPRGRGIGRSGSGLLGGPDIRSGADDERIRVRFCTGRPGIGAAGRGGDVDEPHARKHREHDDGRPGSIRLLDRAAGHLHARRSACRASRRRSGPTWSWARTTGYQPDILTMEVGQMTEEVTVTSRVSEVQSIERRALVHAGQRAPEEYRQRRALVHDLHDARARHLQQGSGGTPPTAVDNFTVNGQRPNSNNVTIDGVANVDTGNNGGAWRRSTSTPSRSSRFCTNSYQAEYGRAVGGQVQVVTKSGTQQFPRHRAIWYGRRSDWNANTWINNRAGNPKAKSSRDDRGYTIGGPVFIPGTFNADKRRLFFFWSQEFQSRSDPVAERLARVPTALERAGDFSQTVDSSGNPFPYIRDYTTGLPCSAANTSGCFADGGVLGRIPANRIYQPGLNALKIYPNANTSRGSGLNYASQRPTVNPRREDMIRMDFQATNSWRVTGRYNKKKDNSEQPYGTTWAGAGSDQLDTLDTLFETPATNWMISSVGILNNSTSLELSLGRAHNSLDFTIQNQTLTRTAAGLTGISAPLPRRGAGRLHSGLHLQRQQRANRQQRRSSADGPRPVHELQHHVRRAGEPVEDLGSARGEVRVLLPEQPEAAEHLCQLQQPDQLRRQRQQPVRYAAQLRQHRNRRLQHVYAGLTSSPSRSGATRTSSGICRTTGRRAAG